jgi:hypothetical protein
MVWLLDPLLSLLRSDKAIQSYSLRRWRFNPITHTFFHDKRSSSNEKNESDGGESCHVSQFESRRARTDEYFVLGAEKCKTTAETAAVLQLARSGHQGNENKKDPSHV